MTDYPWKQVLERADVDLASWDKVSPQIEHSVFKELSLQPNRYIPIYSERERQEKLGPTPNIWPFRNGIGRCVLIRGDMIVRSSYVTQEDSITPLDENKESRSTSLEDATNEREFLIQAYNSRAFHALSGSTELSLGSAGKLYVDGEANYYRPVKLERVQFELDWSVESRNEILLFEAKVSTGKRATEFVLFQVFYPTAYMSKRAGNKAVRPFFLDIVKRSTYVDYHFMEISYARPFDLSSYENRPRQHRTIRVAYQ